MRRTVREFLTRARSWITRQEAIWDATTNRRNLLILILILVGGFVGYSRYIAPPVLFPTEELVSIPSGLSLDALSEELARQQVIQSPFMLRSTIIVLGRATSVRAGDYLFKEPKSLFAIAQAITTGQFGLEPVRVRIPEGATTKEIGVLLAKQLKRIDAERFQEMAQPYEGFLFPDTYFFLPNATEESVILAMRQNFDDKISGIMGDVVSFGRPLNDVVNMASILEKEAFIYRDRRMIAGVLWRRLDKEILLQVDAAFLYSIGRSTHTLTRANLRDENDPYNTYVHKGLPPSPIGNPGLSSLKAAVMPIDEGYLFYLADRSGTTYYSKTYEEHLRKKRIYID
jgi:UPF0755 protein